jgi:hypothetical protein
MPSDIVSLQNNRPDAWALSHFRPAFLRFRFRWQDQKRLYKLQVRRTSFSFRPEKVSSFVWTNDTVAGGKSRA